MERNGPSVGVIRPAHPHEQFLCSKILRTVHKRIHEQKSHGIRGAAWDLEEEVYKIRENFDENRATFFSLSEVWCLSSPSTTFSQWEREYVVDSGASVHLLRKERSEFS